MRLTARRLQLYSTMPGTGAAANEISKAVTEARKRLRASKPQSVQAAAKMIGTLYSSVVYPVMAQHSKLGACDTEPRYVVAQALVDEAKAILGLSPNDYRPELADLI
jgi:hypothetical protein